DSENIYNADVVIIEPQRYAEGTICELGQLKGRRDFAKLIKEKIKNNSSIEEIEELIDTVLNQKIFAHLEDIRRTSIPEIGDRRSFYVNQYVYGVTLDLTKGKGFEEFEDILNQIE
ncbi:MAG: hypothetical protein MRZ81_00855, partial [Peptoniphilaceae bacterium]|nr:hypothetical protein [Peptoniphilaceae bacterium]